MYPERGHATRSGSIRRCRREQVRAEGAPRQCEGSQGSGAPLASLHLQTHRLRQRRLSKQLQRHALSPRRYGVVR